MQYLGGKYKIRKQIAEFLESVRCQGQEYFEPFVGGARVLQEMSGKRTASDNNTAALYAEYRNKQDEHDPLTAFIGFACSFGGKWFGGFARQNGYNFAAGGRRALQKQLPLIIGVRFLAQDYREWHPSDKLVYCDPPYENTTEYKDKFDSYVFWETMREWSKNNTVVVSEYHAPQDFKCVLEIPTKTGLRVNGAVKSRTERLFMYNKGEK